MLKSRSAWILSRFTQMFVSKSIHLYGAKISYKLVG